MKISSPPNVEANGLMAPTSEVARHEMAALLSDRIGSRVYGSSLAKTSHSLFFLGHTKAEKYLGIISSSNEVLERFDGQRVPITWDGQELTLLKCTTALKNAAVLREVFPFLVPRTLGLQKSAGCGDRLGLATPGHIRAIKKGNLAPILAQQSIRENSRTGRTPQQVMDDAMWSVFQEGWREGFGADADHLKTTADIDSCVASGYTFYTIDPGEHVDNDANPLSGYGLQRKISELPWTELESTWEDLKQKLGQSPVGLGNFAVSISEEELARAAAKYGRVIAHTAKMYRHLLAAMDGKAFELEMSVDETETVTTTAEHIYIAHELNRMGVKWVSLAPRYPGTFEKGVDFIGDLAQFEDSFAQHAAIARSYGPYKLSLHSGSDKFTIYPVVARLAGDLIHLKTAGTSYLEALRAIAQINPGLFRKIVAFAITRFPYDRATYHVSAEIGKMPDANRVADESLTTILDNFHAREVLHVTFGSVLQHPDLREPFFSTLREDEETYYQMLETHFGKHFAPFSEGEQNHLIAHSRPAPSERPRSFGD